MGSLANDFFSPRFSPLHTRHQAGVDGRACYSGYTPRSVIVAGTTGTQNLAPCNSLRDCAIIKARELLDVI